MASLLRTPLYDLHVSLGARMVEFAGWEMPVQFAGIVEEHNHTRTACGVFDVSHMGRLKITGKDADTFLDRICTRNLKDAVPGRCFYSHVCREDGGILDDVIVSRFEDHWGIVCNASNREKIIGWLEKHRAGKDVQITDETVDTAMIACQGPKTLDVAKELTGQDFSSLKRYHFTTQQVGPASIVVYRSGYTGEDGLEIVCGAGLARFLVPRLFGTKEKPSAAVKPVGLGARDTLRLEAGMPLYGHELSENWDSLTAGQAWCVDLNKDFIGAEAMRRLKQDELSRCVVGLELEGRRIARQNFPVFHGEKKVGEITSGTLSPTLNKSIAMALVSTASSSPGTTLDVEVSGKWLPARVVPLPFYKRPK